MIAFKTDGKHAFSHTRIILKDGLEEKWTKGRDIVSLCPLYLISCELICHQALIYKANRKKKRIMERNSSGTYLHDPDER